MKKIRRANTHGRPTPPSQFEDIPLDEARRMGRGPRMDPELYHALKEKIQSLDTTATRVTTPGRHQPDHDEKPQHL